MSHVRIVLLPIMLASAGLLSVGPGAAAAQDRRRAFDTLSVAIRVAANVNRDTFHRFWDPDPGVELAFQTPFRFGEVELGVHYASFRAKSAEQPDFRAFFPYLGWGYEAALAPRLRWHNGVRAGTFLMTFDIGGVNRTEQELGLGLQTRLSYQVGGAWSVDVSARYRAVFTRERLHYVFLAAGLERAFPMPRWLREFLD